MGDRSHGATLRPFETARCDLLGNYANGPGVALIGIFRPDGCLVVGTFELPDGVARDVKPEGRSGPSMTVVVMPTPFLRLRNFEFHLG